MNQQELQFQVDESWRNGRDYANRKICVFIDQLHSKAQTDDGKAALKYVLETIARGDFYD